jgi:peptidoglycan/xylan/chitin deacetylase (PgdA/CDA1 family)
MIERRYRWKRSIDKTLPDLTELLRGRAPSFVYGGAVAELPIFTFHVVDESFADALDQLARGGYETVGAAELAAYARGDWSPAPRQVALTFDDGDSSLDRVAAPLLAEHGMRAVAFVVAGLVPDETDEQLTGWRSLRQWVHEGVLEVGAHSEYHHHVPIGPRIIGWVTPETEMHFAANIPVPRVSGARQVGLGHPIFAGRPRYTAKRAFRPDPECVERAALAVEREGPALLRHPRGRRELLRLVGRDGAYESPSEADEAVRADMRRTAARIAEECPNPAAVHLAYPWYARDARADRLAREAGVEVTYGGVTVDRRRTPALRRLPPDFLRRLPGPGRVSLPELVRDRVRAVRNASRPEVASS